MPTTFWHIGTRGASLFLVEIRYDDMGMYPAGKQVPFHTMVEADDLASAHKAASQIAETTDWEGLPFGLDELETVQDDYLWMAGDGSSIWMEVRKLT